MRVLSFLIILRTLIPLIIINLLFPVLECYLKLAELLFHLFYLHVDLAAASSVTVKSKQFQCLHW